MNNDLSDQYKQIGKNISYYRKINGLTQEQLADKIGISPSYLSKIECGNYQKSVSLSMILNLAAGLEVDVVKFFKKKRTPLR